MRHHNSVRKFGRTKNARTALMRGLVISFVTHGRITTTDAKAKELRPMVEKIITRSKVDTLQNRRLVLSALYNNELVTKKLFEEIGPAFANRNGGYTRIYKLPRRTSDGSLMAIIELVA